MSRSDLDEIQKQLKIAIQNHQMLMAQMKNNPQDSSLQSRIRSTQREISSLGEKQKGIFQLLRKNPLNGTPPQDAVPIIKPTPLPAHRPTPPALIPAHATPVSAHTTPSLAHGAPSVAHTAPAGAHLAPAAAHATPVSAHQPKLSTHSGVIPMHIQQAHSNSVVTKPNLVLPANLNSLALTLGPNATLTLPISTGGSLTLPASALPPHLLKPGTRLTLPMGGRNIPLVPVRPKTQQQQQNNNNNTAQQQQHTTTVTNSNPPSNSCSPRPTTSSPAPSPPSNHRSGYSMTSQSPLLTSSQSRTNQITPMEVEDVKPAIPVDPVKMKQSFMSNLDLVSPDKMKELVSKRTERKRRTTANPNFSYGNNYLSERKYGLNNYLSAMQARRHNRHRGESPHPPSHPPSPCSANGVQGHNLQNGQCTDVHDDYCAVCRRSGQLLMCDTCSLVYHLHCLSPPLSQIPTGTWRCPKCEAGYQRRQTCSPLSIPDNNNSPAKPLPPTSLHDVIQPTSRHDVIQPTSRHNVIQPTSHHDVIKSTSLLRQTLTPPFAANQNAASMTSIPTSQAPNMTSSSAGPTTLIIPKPTLTKPTMVAANLTSPRKMTSSPRPTTSPRPATSPRPTTSPRQTSPRPATPPRMSISPRMTSSSPKMASSSPRMSTSPRPTSTSTSPMMKQQITSASSSPRHVTSALVTSSPDRTSGGVMTSGKENVEAAGAGQDSVAILRAVKEEERRALLTHQQTLQSEHAQLQQRAQHLSQSINAQVQTKTDLLQSVEAAQQSIDAIHQFIEVFKTS